MYDIDKAYAAGGVCSCDSIVCDHLSDEYEISRRLDVMFS